MSIISVKNVTKAFGKHVVLNDVSIEIETGKTLVIIGPSGTGKSVLLKHIVGLLKPDKGEVIFDGQKMNTLSPRELAKTRMHFGFLFQMGALFDSLTNAENVGFPLTEHTHKTHAEINRIAREKLAMVGLPNVGNKMPGELSGGQRKRVALARAIAMDPKVILYDEPTTGLDPIRSDVINELILKLQRELNVTSVVVTHDMVSATKVAHRIVMLEGGKIRFDGTAEDIRQSTDDNVQRFVLGRASEEDLASLELK